MFKQIFFYVRHVQYIKPFCSFLCVTRLPLKASEFYADYLFKFLQIETLILVKNSTSNELSYCIRNFKCEEFFQTSLYIDIGKCWSLQTLEDRRLQRSRIQQKRIQKKPHPCPRGGFRQGFFVELIANNAGKNLLLAKADGYTAATHKCSVSSPS